MDNLPQASLYVDGKLRAAAGNRTYDNICPWTGEVIGKAADASVEDVYEAIAGARRAFDQTDWSQKHDVRYALMKRYRDLLFANRDKLVQIVRLEAGSSIGAAYRAQVDRALSGMDDVLACFPSVTWEEDRGRRNEMGIDTDRLVVHIRSSVRPTAPSVELSTGTTAESQRPDSVARNASSIVPS